MGILNITPDSFYDGGRYFNPDAAVRRGFQIAQEGADILDVGGVSTRPGSEPIPPEEELKRVLPVIQQLKEKLAIPISVDTYRSSVAKEALNAGANIVNDVSGLKLDSQMASVVAQSQAGVVVMHMRGTPETMQQDTHYDSLLEEISADLERSVEQAQHSGISKDKILIDPGIGLSFGKDALQNLEILRRLEFFERIGCPILVGPSRKSFIGKVLQKESRDRLWGTLASVASAFYHGAAVIRVHDVGPVREFLEMISAVESA